MNIKKRIQAIFIATLVSSVAVAQDKPNIVVILADDMGYGELQCLNKEGKIQTPSLNEVAKNGMVFTDAHSGSSVCTPTRYGLITGRYSWRTRLQEFVVTGGDSLVAKETTTIADMLKTQGYDTVVIGKWHLGMKYDGVENGKPGAIKKGATVTEGPIDAAGFDKFYGFHHSRQMDLWIEDDQVVETLKPIEMLPKLTKTAEEYITARKESDKPFFMYIPWNSPHSPVVPSKDWQGKSGINAHADFVMETDASYGRVIQALKDAGKYENTLVICTSDNGTSPSTSGLRKLLSVGHNPSGEFRGMKADIWDGGHRVPFIVSWPGRVKAATTCDDLVCLTDILATVAEIIGYKLKEDEGVDSLSFLSSLQGKKNTRRDIIHHSVDGRFSLREKKYKLVCCPGSGGWGAPKDHVQLKKNGDDSLLNYQLYDMLNDKAETKNLAAEQQGEVQRLRAKLQKQIDEGRTTPGPDQKNDIDEIVVDKWKK